MNKKFDKLGFYPADILLPKGQDMNKWAVVACDQFTSEPEYWRAVEEKVGDAPSTLRLILPEANLKAPNVDEYIDDINAAMDAQWSEMKSYEEGGSGWMVLVLLLLAIVISAFNIWRKLRKKSRDNY